MGEYSAFGRTLRAPESALSVPASLGSVVQGVTGLDQSAELLVPNHGQGNAPNQNHGAPGVEFRAGRPCSLWYGEKTVATPNAPAYGTTTKPLAPCGYTPAQVRGLYGLDKVAADGAGQTVAFVGVTASPTLQQDVSRYSVLHNLAAPKITELVAPGVYRHPDTPQQVPGDFYGEETLDAEAIHTTAPGAPLLFVASSNARQDFDASINHVVDRHLASIISISYGFSGENVPNGFITSLNNTFLQAVATGIGVYVSSGDSGDDVTSVGASAVDFYADSPNVTAVGGSSASVKPAGTAPAATYSSVDDPASALNQTGWVRDFEVGWQTGRDALTKTATDNVTTQPYELDGTFTSALPGVFGGGGGGGVSKVYYDEYRIGGTSVAAPLTAGMAAVANQLGGAPLGFLNPRIYSAYNASGSAAYYDVNQADQFGSTTSDPLPSMIRVNFVNSEDASGGLSYSLRTQEQTAQTLHSTKGYDTATGVGTPEGAAFFAAITAP